MRVGLHIDKRTTRWTILAGIVTVFTLVVAFAPQIERLIAHLGLGWIPYRFRRALVDYHDVRVYHRLGIWARSALLPYRDYIAEYPPLSMPIFAAPHILLRIIGLAPTFAHYRILYTFMSGGLLFFAVWLIACIRHQLQRGGFFEQYGRNTLIANPYLQHRAPWLFLFCIASIYFTYNRFDLFPSLFLLASVYLFVKGRVSLSMICWACAFALKWYAAVAIPIYTAYLWQQKEYRVWLRGCVAAVATLALIHLPILLYGGIESILAPYLVHTDRLGNRESFFHLIRLIFSIREGRVLGRVFLAIQLLFPFSFFFVKRLSLQSVVYGVIAAVAAFIFFAIFQSPQWVLWLSPLLLAFACKRRELLLLFLLEAVTYYYFPVLYDSQAYATYAGLTNTLTIALIPQFIIMGSVLVYAVRRALVTRTESVALKM